MARSRSRVPSDFQASGDGRDAYLEQLEARKQEEIIRAGQLRIVRRNIFIAVGLLLSLGVASILVFGAIHNLDQRINALNQRLETRRLIDDGLVWGPDGRPLDNNGMVWIAECPKGFRPVTGTCVVLRADGPNSGVPIQNFGVNPKNNQWECSWTQRVVSAVVRALCAR
jgi:hypothetical protein